MLYPLSYGGGAWLLDRDLHEVGIPAPHSYPSIGLPKRRRVSPSRRSGTSAGASRFRVMGHNQGSRRHGALALSQFILMSADQASAFARTYNPHSSIRRRSWSSIPRPPLTWYESLDRSIFGGCNAISNIRRHGH